MRDTSYTVKEKEKEYSDHRSYALWYLSYNECTSTIFKVKVAVRLFVMLNFKAILHDVLEVG